MANPANMTQEEIKAHNARVDKRVYWIVMAINLVLLFGSAACAIASIYNVFKANWPYSIGFAIISFGTFYVFRHIPWPETEEEKRAREVRSLLGRRFR